jgi:para-aminobenzoate synthetase / 4-amino-4-deoxychorismate lyase
MTPVLPDASAGVFETVLVRDGRPLELDAHLARLAASTAALFGAGGGAAGNGRGEILAAARGVALGRLRMTVVPDADGRTARDVRVTPIDSEIVFPAAPVRLVPIEVPGGLGAHKWADRRLLEAAERDAGAGAVPLLMDAEGTVLESSRANVFARAGDVLLTPPADGRILPGVTRARVLAEARAAGATVREEALSLARLDAADEVFLSGSVRGIEPVRGGRMTESLAAALRRVWEGGP